MAQSLNKQLLIGNIGRDPELKYTQGGQAKLAFSIATSEKWRTKDGDDRERTDWHNCVLWGKRAEALSKILSKGERVYVEGRTEHDEYERDGVKKYFTSVNVSEVVLLGGKGGGASRSESRGGGAQEEYPEAYGGGGGMDDIPFSRAEGP